MEMITLFKFIQKITDAIKSKLSQQGQGMVEYALIIAVVAVIAVLVFNTGLKNSITGAFNSASDQINTTTGNINSMRDSNS